jgi:cyclophilin family peptidyl-prolyl cis-trans isomerase
MRKAMKRLLLIYVILAALVFSACGTPAASTTSQTPAPKSSITPAPSSTAAPVPSAVSTASTTKSAAVTTPAAATTTAVKRWSKPPAMQIDTSKTYFATVDTSLGVFKIQLFASETPNTVNNFIFLSQQGFFDGVIFHRIIKTFMIQTGDPTGTGGGSPGYKFSDELPPKHSYDPGIVAMANAGPNTQGSQFFICTGADAKNLNSMPNYTQFGQVVEGMDIVQKIASVPVGASSSGEISRPKTPPVIKTITITP